MIQYPIELDNLTKDNYGKPLVCSGCGHSASDAPFPGQPSGERPCFFCVRNVQRELWCSDHFKECNGTPIIDGKVVDCRHPAHGVWYNGAKAIKVPMDCYRPCDMLTQIQSWITHASKPVQLQASNVCDVPPDGWYCTREKGHSGPCATIPNPS